MSKENQQNPSDVQSSLPPELQKPFIDSFAQEMDDDSDNATTTGTWNDPDGSDNT